MKNKWIMMAGIAAIGLASPVANALPVGPMVIGNFEYFNFGVSQNIDPNGVTVTAVNTPPAGEAAGIQITGIPTVSVQTDFTFTYKVLVLSGSPITDIGQGFNLSTVGNGGTVIIGETVFTGGFGAGTEVAQSTISFTSLGSDFNDPPGELYDTLNFVPGQTLLWVTKDIQLTPNAQGEVGATSIFQYVSVPDGGATVMLLGAALSAMALFRKKLFA